MEILQGEALCIPPYLFVVQVQAYLHTVDSQQKITLPELMRVETVWVIL